MQIKIGVAKVGRYASGESGDTVEIVERPRGGLSVVIVDGQGHGRAAKRISHQIAGKAAALIGDGARDGAVMRAISDFLYTIRDGKVSATVSILSSDMEAKSLIVSRNSNCPVVVGHQDGSSCLDGGVNPIGVHKSNRPVVSHWPAYPGTVLVGFTDGVIHSGRFGDNPGFSMDDVFRLVRLDVMDPQALANRLLRMAVDRDQGKPRDDMLVAALALCDGGDDLGTRQMTVDYPC